MNDPKNQLEAIKHQKDLMANQGFKRPESKDLLHSKELVALSFPHICLWW